MRFPPALTPGQDAALRFDTAERAAKRLTERDKLILRKGAAHPNGVINPFSEKFGGTARRMARMEAAGVVTANAHGDWYITETGRLALTL